MPNRDLPPKESTLFKSTLKMFEFRQYKKGLKTADQILKKFPEHGESLAMRGLFLANLDRREEGFDSIKKGLRLDLTSGIFLLLNCNIRYLLICPSYFGICWHVYGLVYRQDKNYAEASKCYLQAMKFDKTNLQVMKDYSLLQLQMRNLDNYIQVAHQLVDLRPTNKSYWIGLAVAYHKAGNLETALTILNSFLETQGQPIIDYETSETLLYKNSLLEESCLYNEALAHLSEVHPFILDDTYWMEAKGRLLMKVNQMETAHEVYSSLFHNNPDSRLYFNKLLETKNLSESTQEAISFVETNLNHKYPKSHIIKHFFLKTAPSELELEKLLSSFIKVNIIKGIPSLFNSIQYLYKDPIKAKLIEKISFNFEQNLQTKNSFSEDKGNEPPSSLLWILYFRAQHFDATGEFQKALEYIQMAIEHTPTLVELYMKKARILKHAGDLRAASKSMNFARDLDLQDRFINSKAAKYFLRENEIDKAIKTIGFFTKAEIEPIVDLNDMQCSWFITECGDAYFRKGDYGMALKQYHSVEKIFNDVYDDQFDFHTYSTRKCVLKSYMEMLRFEDGIFNHPYYKKAALSASKTYITLYEKQVEEENAKNNAPAELKKLEKKARKAEAKAAATAAATQPPSKGDKKVDEDPKGLKYLNAPDFLNEALKFVNILNQYSPQCLEGWVHSSYLFLKQGKLLLSFKSLLKALELNSKSHLIIKVHYEIWTKIIETQKTLHPSIQETLRILMSESPFFSSTPSEYLISIIKDQSNPLFFIQVARSLLPHNEKSRQVIIQLFDSFKLQTHLDYYIVSEVFTFLKSELKDESLSLKWKLICRDLFPFSTLFK